jgi:hypothetical protein
VLALPRQGGLELILEYEPRKTFEFCSSCIAQLKPGHKLQKPDHDLCEPPFEFEEIKVGKRVAVWGPTIAEMLLGAKDLKQLDEWYYDALAERNKFNISKRTWVKRIRPAYIYRTRELRGKAIITDLRKEAK